MQPNALTDTMARCGVIPVIAIESPELALPLADVLSEGGLPVAEITFRTEAAGDSIRRLKKERPDLLLGAGTLLSVDHLLQARDAGAQFGVAPGFNPEVVQKANEIHFPFFPGVMTPSEIERGLAMDITTLKYFPAEASGGAGMLQAVSAPFAHLGVRFIPTGGVTIDNLAQYLGLPSVLAVGGTWIAPKDMISKGKWDAIRTNARTAKDAVSEIRGA